MDLHIFISGLQPKSTWAAAEVNQPARQIRLAVCHVLCQM